MSYEAVESGDAREAAVAMEGDAPSWSKLAIATFVLSLVTPLAAFHWVFWPIAFLVFAFAILSIGLVVYGGKSVRGGGLACFALFLSLFSLSFGVTRFATAQQLMQSEAQAAAEHFFDLIMQGKLEEAHQMTMGSEYRESPEIPLKDAYELSSQLSTGRDTYFQTPPLQYLLKDPKNCKIRIIGFGARSFDEKAEAIQVKFSIRYREQDIPRESTFAITAARYREPRFEDHRWVMRGITAFDAK